MAKKVFVIVLNWNGYQDTIECVESLKGVDYPGLEIIIIENGSTDGSEEMIRKRFPELTVIQTGVNLGFAGGSNAGLRHALSSGADYMVLLNNDTTVDPSFVKELVRAAQTDERIGLLSSKVYFYGAPEVLWYAGGGFNPWLGWGRMRGYGRRDDGQFDAVEETDRAGGCSLMLTRRFCEKVGLFDEEYFCYCEDLDLGIRAKRAGFKVMYVPSSKVWHKESKSTGGSTAAVSLYYTVRNTLKCVDKNNPLPFFLRMARYASLLAISFLSLFTMKTPKIQGVKRIYQGARDYFQQRFGEFRPKNRP
ncbi:MAG: glycosyltransferase family 2 protein [Deltaproteobacteria bacterium]|nr:glycosyltransferase family 2 protein [Deltaproteobacteria bacterium]